MCTLAPLQTRILEPLDSVASQQTTNIEAHHNGRSLVVHALKEPLFHAVKEPLSHAREIGKDMETNQANKIGHGKIKAKFRLCCNEWLEDRDMCIKKAESDQLPRKTSSYLVPGMLVTS